MKEVEVKMEERAEVAPKIGAIQFNNVLVTTEFNGPKSENIILMKDTMKREIREVQTIVAKGSLVSDEIMNVGDRVLLDTEKLGGKRANGEPAIRLIYLPFNKYTGELVTSLNDEGVPENDINHYLLISDREVLMVL